MTLGVTEDTNYQNIANAIRAMSASGTSQTMTPSEMASAIRALKATWGDIDGNITDQTDLQNALANINPSWGNISGSITDQTDLQNSVNGNPVMFQTISENEDLNNYLEYGTYRVLTSAIANSILNIPIKTSGRLIVTGLTQGLNPSSTTITFIQIYITTKSNSKCYIRWGSKTSSSALPEYSDWKELAFKDALVRIDDTVGDGATDKVWSADKTFDEISDLKNSVDNENLINNVIAPNNVDKLNIDGANFSANAAAYFEYIEKGIKITCSKDAQGIVVRCPNLSTYTLLGLKNNTYYTFSCNVSAFSFAEQRNLNLYVSQWDENNTVLQDNYYYQLLQVPQGEVASIRNTSATFYVLENTAYIRLEVKFTISKNSTLKIGDYFTLSELQLKEGRSNTKWKPNIHDILNYNYSNNNLLQEEYVINWSPGTINLDGSNNDSSDSKNKRKRSITNLFNYIYDSSSDKNAIISVASGYETKIIVYEANDDYSCNSTNFKYILFNNEWKSNINYITLEPNVFYRFILRKIDNSEFTENEDLLHIIKISYDIPKINDASTSNIINRNDVVETKTKLTQMIRPQRITSYDYGTPVFTLLHFSDIHGDYKCLNNILEYYNYYNKYITDILHTGDCVRGNYNDGFDYWNINENNKYILNCIGNHDSTTGVNGYQGASMQECYLRYFADYIENWNANYNINKTFYYKDYPENNIRLIVLDAIHQTEEQLSWFQTTLDSARQSSYHVIVASHMRPSYKLSHFVGNSWDDGIILNQFGKRAFAPGEPTIYTDSSQTVSPDNLSEAYPNAVDSFLNNGGHFVCWLYGHVHYKVFAKLTDHERQIAIAASNAGRPKYCNTYIYSRETNTKAEDDFNIMAVDTYSGILKLMKVGVNYDVCMRRVDTLSYDYLNNKLIFSNDPI